MNAKVKAIKPSEIAGRKAKSMPPAVLESFNELIAENFSGGSATVVQKDVVKRMVSKGLKSADIYENGWLDVEGIFEKNGWSVHYDKPGYCESYDAFFEFESK